MIISKRKDVVFAECNCGCTIISFNELDKDEMYLSYFGSQKIKLADFVFYKNFNEFIALLTGACNFIFTDKERVNFREVEIGYVENKTDREALSVHIDSLGVVTINKYRKNYKKFIKGHDQEFYLTHFRDSVPYDKCKCDWEFLIDRDGAKMLRDALLQMTNGDYKKQD